MILYTVKTTTKILRFLPKKRHLEIYRTNNQNLCLVGRRDNKTYEKEKVRCYIDQNLICRLSYLCHIIL